MTRPDDMIAGAGSTPAPDSVPMREAIDLLEDAVAFFDADGGILATNLSFRDAYGEIAQYIREGSSWEIFLLEAERHAALDGAVCQQLRLAETMLGGQGATPAAIEHRGDANRAYEIRLKPTSNGGFAMVQTEVIDTRGRAESDELAEVLMSKVLEACPANLTMSRIGDGQILYRTPAATELLGAVRNSRDHFARVEERADFVTALLPDARVDDMRVTGRRRDGSAFPASLSARLIDYRGDEVVVANMIDLTDEIALQAELERQKDLAFQSEKMSALGELLASVAHELNNPLSVVVGNATMLSEEDLGEAALRRVSKLSDAADRCVRIVRTFLSMARQQPLNLSDVSLAELVETALDALQSHAETSSVEIEVSLPQSLPLVRVDDIQVVQVILNILANADQAIGESGIGDRIRISAAEEAATGQVRVTIADNGPGVPEQIHGRIFDPLFTTKSKGRGTGVGLAFCHRVISAHGGAIELERRSTSGATFVIDLPVAGP
ncbi:phospho-acceptor domain-containing protein [Aliiruegeria haliotis]|uniref:histidine kinase n=1 Tax=Aliiruegeria haliotis TaxID=1280846 RepID=A0A2T0RZ04_9RHOB|nr:ATP-binding protein [Aliiruegeria haliotis]PRY26404.1 phospho-acceptor domain-containing protein [Aliiruegeria haliotis]